MAAVSPAFIVPRRHPLMRGTSEEQELELALLRETNALLRREVAELKERQAEAQRLADRDGLTGLYNHRRMLELMDSAIAEAGKLGHCVGLLFIDLNGFKEINDECGHAAGDRLLAATAQRIAQRVRAGDLVCRYGGDEFVVILPNVPDAAAVSRVADTVRERLALSHWIEGRERFSTAAVGESLYPRDGATAAELLRRADQHMYRFKARCCRPTARLDRNLPQRPTRRRGDDVEPARGEAGAVRCKAAGVGSETVVVRGKAAGVKGETVVVRRKAVGVNSDPVAVRGKVAEVGGESPARRVVQGHTSPGCKAAD